MTAGPILVPCLVQLRAEFNQIAPNRALGADGWIGDQAHQDRVSDHNDDEVGKVPIHDADKIHEVHGLDITRDLRVPGLELADVVRHVLTRCRSGAENRLRYTIWDHEIFEASNGWRARPYDGDDPHTGHAHFSSSYDTLREADTRSWTLEETPVLTDADMTKIETLVTKVVDARLKTWAKVDPIASINVRTDALANKYGLADVAADVREIDNAVTKQGMVLDKVLAKLDELLPGQV